MSRTLRTTLALLCCLGTASAQAAIITYSGDFSADTLAGGGGGKNPTSLSGSWSFDFDDSQLSPTGGGVFQDIALTGLNLMPNVVGATTFDLSNTFGFLIMSGGNPFVIAIHGAPNGSSTNAGTDDFRVNYSGSTGTVFEIEIANAGLTGISGFTNISGTFSASSATVPVPGTIALTMLGIGALGVRRRLKGSGHLNEG